MRSDGRSHCWTYLLLGPVPIPPAPESMGLTNAGAAASCTAGAEEQCSQYLLSGYHERVLQHVYMLVIEPLELASDSPLDNNITMSK